MYSWSVLLTRSFTGEVRTIPYWFCIVTGSLFLFLWLSASLLFVLLLIWSYFCRTPHTASLMKDKQEPAAFKEEFSSPTRNQVLFFTDEFPLMFFLVDSFTPLRQQLFIALMSESLLASFLVLLLQEEAAIWNINKKVSHITFIFPRPQAQSCQWVWETWGWAASERHSSLDVCTARKKYPMEIVLQGLYRSQKKVLGKMHKTRCRREEMVLCRKGDGLHSVRCDRRLFLTSHRGDYCGKETPTQHFM